MLYDKYDKAYFIMDVIEELGYLKSIYGLEKVMTINGLKSQMMVSEIKIRHKLTKT